MKGIVLVKGTVSGDVRAHVAMRLGRFEKVERKSVGDSSNIELLRITCGRKKFKELKEELNTYYPNKCMFLTKKALV